MRKIDRVRRVMLDAESNWLYLSQIIQRTGMTPKECSRAVHSLLHRRKELEYKKPKDSSYGVYRYLGKPNEVRNGLRHVSDLTIKLAQLRTHKDKLRRIGITTIDSIIEDYENS